MNRRQLKRLDGELSEYLDSMFAGIGRRERRASLESYIAGLLLDGDRKSIEPMAGRLVDDASEMEAMRQRLQQAVVIADWPDEEMFRRLALKLDVELPGVEALVVDDTGFPKKGVHSVGVARQYSGTLGRVENCQVGVILHLAGEHSSACIGLSLYLSKEWASDATRRTKTGVPTDVQFREKWRIALDLVDVALDAGTRRHVTLADAGYGDIREFRAGLTERKLDYVVGVKGETVVWAPDASPQVPARRRPSGRAPQRWQDERHPPVAVAQLAAGLNFRKVIWREGSRGWQSSRFAAARVRTAYRHQHSFEPGEEQWLLCQWFDGDNAPSKYWLSTVPVDTTIRTLVRLAKLRWRVERDYQEMKQEVGLDHFEGRSWRGFHHHATLCALAHAFLALRRALSPPEDSVDAADGPSGASAGPSQTRRLLPALSPHHRSQRATDGSIANLIE